MAKVINKGGTDKTVILSVREFCAQPVQAPEWTDLRVGFLLSLTKALSDDDPATLAEDIGNAPPPVVLLGDVDRFQVGLTDSATGTIFAGYTNRNIGRSVGTPGQSRLVSSDGGIGTTNAYFWRPKNRFTDAYSAMIVDQGINRSPTSGPGCEIHFPQDPANAGGYATLLALRFTRPNAGNQAKNITMRIKKDAAARRGDVLFTNTPTKDVLLTAMEDFATTVEQFGPYLLSQEPDTLFLYWPFHSSRLRIHCMGILKVA